MVESLISIWKKVWCLIVYDRKFVYVHDGKSMESLLKKVASTWLLTCFEEFDVYAHLPTRCDVLSRNWSEIFKVIVYCFQRKYIQNPKKGLTSKPWFLSKGLATQSTKCLFYMYTVYSGQLNSIDFMESILFKETESQCLVIQRTKG